MIILEAKHDGALTLEFKQVSDEISKLRLAGKLKEATDVCNEAIKTFPESHFLSKIQADLYFQQSEYESSFIALGDYLSKIPASDDKYVAEFARRYYRLKRTIPQNEISRFAEILNTTLVQAPIDQIVVQKVKKIISSDIIAIKHPAEQPEQLVQFVVLLKNDSTFDKLAKLEKVLEIKHRFQIEQLLDEHILNRARSSETSRVDLYCASLYEKFEAFSKGIKVLTEILNFRLNPIAARSLFRICRVIKNYECADDFISKTPVLLKSSDFNILYELVYYFEAKNDRPQLERVLRTIDKGFADSLPILRTLKNFYIRFGMPDELRILESKIQAIHQAKNETSGKYNKEIIESEAGAASKVAELTTQLEHQKQLAAISDLTTGISHELGQPITNIRYMIQYYKKLLEKNITKDGVFNVFDSILEETTRMGALIQRLSPLTSSRSLFEIFDLVDRINKRVQLESPRLRDNRILVSIEPKTQVTIYGDPVKFDQLISNLLLNAIDAITERKKLSKNKIGIKVEDGTQEVRISISDNGVGIPIKNRNKIFDPFFSTKAPGKGEGLGLFIVWNLLKIQGGKISVDANFTNGARFVITIPKMFESNKDFKS